MADWQLIIALILVGCAVAYLVRSFWQSGKGQGTTACGGCQKCPVREDRHTERELPLVDIQTLVPPRDRPDSSNGR